MVPKHDWFAEVIRVTLCSGDRQVLVGSICVDAEDLVIISMG